MNLRKIARFASVFLLVVSVALYVASKVHFLTHYNPNRTSDYLREHSAYWVLTAITALFIWVLERYSPKL
jgi:uncharacterized membrane protein YidH (DUF202 family)